MTMIFGIPVAGVPRPAAGRAHQRLVLRHAEPRPRDHLRPAAGHQLRAWRAIHAGRLRRLPAAGASRHRLLAGPDPGAADRRRHRRGDRAAGAVAALRCRSALWPAAHLRPRLDARRRVPLLLRRLRQSLRRAAAAGRRHQSRLHVPAELPRLGGDRLAHPLPRHLARDREDQARLLSARRHRESQPGAGVRRQRPAADDPDLRPRLGACRPRRHPRRAGLSGQPADGLQPHHRGVRGGGDRRHGLDPRRHRHRLPARPRRRA